MTTEADIFLNMEYEIADNISPSQFEKAKDVLLEVRLLEDAGWIKKTER